MSDTHKNFDITYVIPTLNSGKTLETTLHCLKKQENITAEIIVVDSGSTDDTLDICQRWGVKTMFAEKGNIYRAINVGLRNAQTEWIGYINSDDWLYCDSVAKMISLGNSENADLVYGRCDFTDEYGRFIFSYEPVKTPRQMLSVFLIPALGFSQQATIYRKKLFDRLNGFDDTYQLSADMDFFLRAFNSEAKFAFLDDFPVACFRLHSKQLSSQRSGEMEQESARIRQLIKRKKNIADLYYIFQWRSSNLVNYMNKFLRLSSLCQKPTLTKNIEITALHNQE